MLVPEIYYPVFARAPLLCGAEVRWVPMRAEDDFVLDLDAIPAADRKRAKILIANYPNNPTGARVEVDFHERAVEFARQNDLLYVSDMAYSELTFGGRPAPSALEADPDREVTVEFHSCSKTFSMAGMRIGFVVGNARRRRGARGVSHERRLRHADGDAGGGDVRAQPPRRAGAGDGGRVQGASRRDDERLPRGRLERRAAAGVDVPLAPGARGSRTTGSGCAR